MSQNDNNESTENTESGKAAIEAAETTGDTANETSDEVVDHGEDHGEDHGDHHDEHDLGPTGEDAVEPDETPDRFLMIVGAVLTVGVIASFIIGVTLFDSTLASERAAKGYKNVPAYELSR